MAALSLLLSGCHLSTFPDPNDPNGAGALQPEVLRRQVKGASDSLYARVTGGEIDDRTYRRLLAQYTDDLLKRIQIDRVDPAKAWEYGEVFRTGQLWDRAEKTYAIAMKAAANDDRRVNDTLRHAEALAHLGRVEEAVKEARSTFDAPPTEKAPILFSVLYEIVPGGRGKGKDLLLAHLLEDAIAQSSMVQVDLKSDAGKAFMTALPHHQHNARELAARLYLDGDRTSDAERVLSGKPSTIRI